jgi:uncharacterized protein
MKLVNVRTGAVLGERIVRADTFFSRARGLLGRASLEPGEGLWIEPCSSIHMFCMRFPIDALFVDRERCVTRLVPALRPWRVASGGRFARAVVELAVGTIDASSTRIGDRLEIVG